MKRFILFIGTFLIMCMSVMFSGCSEIDNVKTDLIVDIVSVNEDVSVCAIPEFIDSEKTYNIECQKIIGNMAITRALAIPGNILIPYATMTQLPVELVSIHAPARGATKIKRRSSKALEFQSTHPRGVRQKCSLKGWSKLS